LLKAVAPPSTHAFFRRFSIEVTGGPRTDSLLVKAIANKFTDEESRAQALETLRRLVRRLIAAKPELGLTKFSKGNFLAFTDLHSRAKKTRTTTVKKKGKTKQFVATITPTKPSILSTVAPYEKQCVKELYETPWTAMQELQHSFEDMDEFKIDYPFFIKKIGQLEERMWQNKQNVLRQTKHRMVARKGATLAEKIRETAERFAKLTSAETYHELHQEVDHGRYPIIPATWRTSDGIEINGFAIYLKVDEGATGKFPASSTLVRSTEKIALAKWKALQKQKHPSPPPEKREKDDELQDLTLLGNQ